MRRSTVLMRRSSRDKAVQSPDQALTPSGRNNNNTNPESRSRVRSPDQALAPRGRKNHKKKLMNAGTHGDGGSRRSPPRGDRSSQGGSRGPRRRSEQMRANSMMAWQHTERYGMQPNETRESRSSRRAHNTLRTVAATVSCLLPPRPRALTRRSSRDKACGSNQSSDARAVGA